MTLYVGINDKQLQMYTLCCSVNILACSRNKDFWSRINAIRWSVDALQPPPPSSACISILTILWESWDPFSVPSRPNIDKKETYIYPMNFVSKRLSPQSHTKWSKANVQKVGELTQEYLWQNKYFRSTLLQCNLVRQPLIVVKRHVAVNHSQVVNPS